MPFARKKTFYRIFADTDEIGIWGNYEDRAEFKSLPGAYWDKDDRCWRVGRRFLTEVEDLVETLNSGMPGSGSKASSPSAPIPSQRSELLKAMLRAIPAEQSERTYKALVKTWHPDVGGETGLMADLNNAWDRFKQGK